MSQLEMLHRNNPQEKQEPLNFQHNTTRTTRYIPRINNDSTLREINQYMP